MKRNQSGSFTSSRMKGASSGLSRLKTSRSVSSIRMRHLEVETQDELQHPTIRGGGEPTADAGVQVHALAQVGIEHRIEHLAILGEMPEVGELAQLVIALEPQLVAAVGQVGELAVHVQG